MRDSIIKCSIEILLRDGLRFSVDDVAKTLKISKKTIYRYFPAKEDLAVEIYKTHYENAMRKIETISDARSEDALLQFLRVYYQSVYMARDEIFNKYALNAKICALAKLNCERIKSRFENVLPQSDKSPLMIIVDGALKNLCDNQIDEEKVFERLVTLLC